MVSMYEMVTYSNVYIYASSKKVLQLDPSYVGGVLNDIQGFVSAPASSGYHGNSSPIPWSSLLLL